MSVFTFSHLVRSAESLIKTLYDAAPGTSSQSRTTALSHTVTVTLVGATGFAGSGVAVGVFVAIGVGVEVPTGKLEEKTD